MCFKKIQLKIFKFNLKVFIVKDWCYFFDFMKHLSVLKQFFKLQYTFNKKKKKAIYLFEKKKIFSYHMLKCALL
jgi:hypothetical protein